MLSVQISCESPKTPIAPCGKSAHAQKHKVVTIAFCAWSARRREKMRNIHEGIKIYVFAYKLCQKLVLFFSARALRLLSLR